MHDEPNNLSAAKGILWGAILGAASWFLALALLTLILD